VESGYAESIIITLYLDKSAKKRKHQRTGKGATTTTPKLREFEPGSRPPSRPSRTHPNKANWGGANKDSRPARRTSRSGETTNEPGEHRQTERFNESGEHRQTGRAPTSRNSRISQWCSYWTAALQRKSPNCEFIKSPYCHIAILPYCECPAVLPARHIAKFCLFGQFWRGKKAPPTFSLME
jgi:hypothetical protein